MQKRDRGELILLARRQATLSRLLQPESGRKRQAMSSLHAAYPWHSDCFQGQGFSWLLPDLRDVWDLTHWYQHLLRQGLEPILPRVLYQKTWKVLCCVRTSDCSQPGELRVRRLWLSQGLLQVRKVRFAYRLWRGFFQIQKRRQSIFMWKMCIVVNRKCWIMFAIMSFLSYRIKTAKNEYSAIVTKVIHSFVLDLHFRSINVYNYVLVPCSVNLF